MTTWTPEEQKAHRKLWVEALRSGKYERAEGALVDVKTGGMCCLGVACEISGIGRWDGDTYVAPNGSHNRILPGEVQNWLGLRLSDSHYSYGPLRGTQLSEKNDNGASFEELAAIIESEPEGLIAQPVAV